MEADRSITQELVKTSSGGLKDQSALELLVNLFQTRKRLYFVTLTDTLAFENEAHATVTNLRMESTQEGFWIRNLVNNHCLRLFLLIYFCVCVVSHKMAVLVAIIFPPRVSVCLLFPPPVSFVSPFVRGC